MTSKQAIQRTSGAEAQGRSDTATTIREAAAEIIATSGYAAATTRKVADLAGVRPGVVHYHAESIEALRRDAMLSAVSDVFGDTFPSGSTHDIVSALFERVSPRVPHSRNERLLVESLLASHHDHVLREQIAQLLQGARSALADRFREEGDPQPENRATLTMAALDGYVLQRSLDPQLEAQPLIDALFGEGGRL